MAPLEEISQIVGGMQAWENSERVANDGKRGKRCATICKRRQTMKRAGNVEQTVVGSESAGNCVTVCRGC